jgi:hypothetical protein
MFHNAVAQMMSAPDKDAQQQPTPYTRKAKLDAPLRKQLDVEAILANAQLGVVKNGKVVPVETKVETVVLKVSQRRAAGELVAGKLNPHKAGSARKKAKVKNAKPAAKPVKQKKQSKAKGKKG